jgi:hypothetical protein
MKRTMIQIAVTMITSLIISADVPFQEQQYRAKYGRYTPAYEAKLKSEPTAKSFLQIEEVAPDCCRNLHTAQIDLAEERNRAKYGRYSPRKEAQVRAAQVELAGHVRACRVLERCPLPAATLPAPAALSIGEAQSLAKYGRVFAAQKATVAVVAARHTKRCEHACCKDTE